MLENQARFDERQAQFEKNQARFEERQARFDENMAAILENQARFDAEMLRMQEAITGLIQVARIHNEQIDQQRERVDALIRVVEGHVSNHT